MTKLSPLQDRYAAMLDAAGIVLTPQEHCDIEVADFGLGEADLFLDPRIQRIE